MKTFLAGIMLGMIMMDLVNCHLYRLGQVVHWIDVFAMLLWPVLIYTLVLILNEQVEERIKHHEEKTHKEVV